MSSPILRGWKEIAEYLKVHEDTAKRWFKKDRMPVNQRNGRVSADKDELRAWEAKYERKG